MSVSLCENCRKGQQEMCQYFKDHFLKEGKRVVKCPAFEEHDERIILEGGTYEIACVVQYYALRKNIFVTVPDPVRFVNMLVEVGLSVHLDGGYASIKIKAVDTIEIKMINNKKILIKGYQSDHQHNEGH